MRNKGTESEESDGFREGIAGWQASRGIVRTFSGSSGSSEG